MTEGQAGPEVWIGSCRLRSPGRIRPGSRTAAHRRQGPGRSAPRGRGVHLTVRNGEGRIPRLSHGDRTLADRIGALHHVTACAGELLRTVEGLTNAGVVPEGACNTWRALHAGTREFADDLIEHIHLGNNVLFPRFET